MGVSLAHRRDSYETPSMYQETFCLMCDRRWHTLVVPPPPTYVGVPGLYERKLRMFQILLCPNGGAHLRQLVVHIFKVDPVVRISVTFGARAWCPTRRAGRADATSETVPCHTFGA